MTDFHDQVKQEINYWNSLEGVTRSYEEARDLIEESLRAEYGGDSKHAVNLGIEGYTKLRTVKERVERLSPSWEKQELLAKLRLSAEVLAYKVFRIPRTPRTPPAPVPTPWRTNGKTD